MWANNETGVIQPLEQLVQECRCRGILLHTDAVQVVGKLPVDFGQLGVDAMSFAAHKLQGPCGIGGLIVRHGVTLRPILFGGAQQLGARPGTEPVALVLGMLAALRMWQSEAQNVPDQTRRLRDALESRLVAEPCQAIVNGAEPRLPNTTNVSFPGLDRQALLIALDMGGIACSTGSACASGSSEPSRVLQAMGLEEDRVESSIRLSLGRFTTASEAGTAAERILSTVSRLRRPILASKSPRASREAGPKSV